MIQNKELLEHALSEYGTEEVVGKKHNPRVVAMFAAAGHPEVTNDETAWCAAFLNAMLAKSGMPTTGSLLARSFLDLGDDLAVPEMGDVVVMWTVAKDDWRGHCGIFIKKDESWIYILGGNQANKVSIAKYPIYQLLGYRRLTIEALPENEKCPTIEA